MKGSRPQHETGVSASREAGRDLLPGELREIRAGLRRAVRAARIPALSRDKFVDEARCGFQAIEIQLEWIEETIREGTFDFANQSLPVVRWLGGEASWLGALSLDLLYRPETRNLGEMVHRLALCRIETAPRFLSFRVGRVPSLRIECGGLRPGMDRS